MWQVSGGTGFREASSLAITVGVLISGKGFWGRRLCEARYELAVGDTIWADLNIKNTHFETWNIPGSKRTAMESQEGRKEHSSQTLRHVLRQRTSILFRHHHLDTYRSRCQHTAVVAISVERKSEEQYCYCKVCSTALYTVWTLCGEHYSCAVVMVYSTGWWLQFATPFVFYTIKIQPVRDANSFLSHTMLQYVILGRSCHRSIHNCIHATTAWNSSIVMQVLLFCLLFRRSKERC